MSALTLGRGARPVRFALTGLAAGLTQLGLLAVFSAEGVASLPGNTMAFMLAAQVNFALSQLFTWRDRPPTAHIAPVLAQRWLVFHGSIAGTAVLNMAVFAVTRPFVPDLIAAALGIVAASAVNYIVHDRVTFRAAVPAVMPRPIRIVAERPARVDVVIPVYNEQRVLEASITKLHTFLQSNLAHDWCIMIADNASTDATLAIARAAADRFDRVQVLHLDEKGRGRALRAAWLGTDADVLIYMDVDLSTDLAAVPALVQAIVDEGYDLATGRRLGAGARVERRKPLREMTSRGYNLVIKTLFRTRFTDAQCGFKAISRQAAAALVPQIKDQAWFFDTELLLLAEWHGYRIKQIPVHWVDDPDSRVNIVQTAMADLRGLRRMLRTRARLRAEARMRRVTPIQDDTRRPPRTNLRGLG
jgi:putative flippase GtrA